MRKGGGISDRKLPNHKPKLPPELLIQSNDDCDDKTTGSHSVAVIKHLLQEAMNTLGEKNERHQIGNHRVMDRLPRILF